MAKKGFFIVFEGIDASGKNTYLHNLEKKIEGLNKWQDIVRTHEPWRSSEIKRKLETEKDAYSNAAEIAELYLEDRARHTQRLIRPNLEAGAVVLCSRYTLSTCAYQWAQGLSLPELMKMHEHRGILIPDITFFLDIPPEVAAQRRATRTASLEKFEQNPLFIDKLVNAYKSLIHMSEVDASIFGRVMVIDANRNPDDVTNDIYGEFVKIYKSSS
ncbi:MAG: dTMP kinase [Nanoarchaeota archaeon]|nr:dTMP kinase [Nanoarchaeota archaeon]